MKIPSEFNIVAILPFWRYAVSPGHAFAPGIPFYTLKAARKLFEEAKRDLPFCPVFLLKRPSFLWQSVDCIDYYDPEEAINEWTKED